jgi:GT2 family glycosyltransferase
MMTSITSGNQNPLVSVVVATVVGGELFEKCLASLSNQSYRPYELIVVDNGSEKEIRSLVRDICPEARVIRNEENVGFAKGYNRGIQDSVGDYVAVINDDAIASPGWLSAMMVTAQNDPSIGTVGSVILDANRPGLLDSCGVGIGLDGMSRQLMKGQSPPQFDRPKEVLIVTACACLFWAKALSEIGLFDEDFFAYCEDTDLGLRLQWAGWKAVIAPGAIVEHHYSVTSGRFGLRKVFWVERNRLWVALKNFPLVLLPLIFPATLWRYMLQMYFSVKGIPGVRGFIDQSSLRRTVLTLLRAIYASIIGIPSMIRKRLAFRGLRRRDSIEMAKLILMNRMPTRKILVE